MEIKNMEITKRAKKTNSTIIVIIVLTICLIGILLYRISYKSSSSKKSEEKVINDCISLCHYFKGKIDYSTGPCLSDIANKSLWQHPDWVCDIAHYPREEEDNKPENQCNAYRQGIAHHFVEVDPSCNFIRKY